MKDFYLNELSIGKTENIQNARNLMKNFIYSVASLRKYGFNALRMTENININNLEIASGYYIYQWRKDIEVARELQTRFRSIVTQVPMINKDNLVLLEKVKKTDIYLNEKPIISLTAAYNDDSVVVSLLTNPQWNSPIIQAELTEIDENNILSNQIHIRNVSQIEHLVEHIDWIKGFVELPPFHHSDPLLYKIISNNTTELDDGLFYSTTVSLSEGEKIGHYRIISKKIALLNLYTFNRQLSQKNLNRYIFQNYNQSLYLALDTQHGRFECCNQKGKHQGEFDFYGTQTKEADLTGTHDIIL